MFIYSRTIPVVQKASNRPANWTTWRLLPGWAIRTLTSSTTPPTLRERCGGWSAPSARKWALTPATVCSRTLANSSSSSRAHCPTTAYFRPSRISKSHTRTCSRTPITKSGWGNGAKKVRKESWIRYGICNFLFRGLIYVICLFLKFSLCVLLLKVFVFLMMSRYSVKFFLYFVVLHISFYEIV